MPELLLLSDGFEDEVVIFEWFGFAPPPSQKAQSVVCVSASVTYSLNTVLL